jgi:hypothetical protein
MKFQTPFFIFMTGFILTCQLEMKAAKTDQAWKQKDEYCMWAHGNEVRSTQYFADDYKKINFFVLMLFVIVR